MHLILVVLSVMSLGANAAYYDVTMMEALVDMRANILIDLLKTTGLDSMFSDLTTNVTLFVPSDRAFTQDLRNLGVTADDLKKDVDKLKMVLTYHVLQGRHLMREFTNEKMMTTASGDQLRFNHYLYNNRYFADGSSLQSSDIETKNGVIHRVSHILFPFQGTVYDIIANDTELSTLKAAIDAAGLADFLRDQNPITIFCPTNSAFSALGDLVPKILADKDLLTAILAYHVIPGSLYRGGLHDTALHTFEEKDRITLDHHGSSFDEVDDARFSKYDISALNGVVHKIEKVLVPASVEAQIKNL